MQIPKELEKCRLFGKRSQKYHARVYSYITEAKKIKE